MKDELAPLSGAYKQHFGGWGANIVDNLDTLYIMSIGGTMFAENHFKVAVNDIIHIDVGKCAVDEINVFETTIRHLGGILSGYELSGEKLLLDKAIDFGEMLLVAFDTPNRMPITRWKPQQALKEAQTADEKVLVAEIGSLSLEFTRLSQITGDPKWYDAVRRIVERFDESQSKTHLPGMWPVTINAQTEDFTQDTYFTLGGMSDSLYEYFPKMHALLGGADPVYHKLYNESMATAIKYNLWRPMTPDNADILLAGPVRATGERPPTLEPEGQHLACFAGGMFALGGKLFNDSSHVEIGRKLTEGCIWAYQNMPSGIMPEVFNMAPCPSPRPGSRENACLWDEHAYRAEVAAQNRLTNSPDAKIDAIIKEARLPKGFTKISDTRYALRPEAIESIFILYRITGERRLMDVAWEMFRSINSATHAKYGSAAVKDVTLSAEELLRGREPGGPVTQLDSMESFWMAETLKYFYLLFSEPDVLSLDEWVFNTEAHPFKRALPAGTKMVSKTTG
nr:endoplasmic reticulum mannosyl-oligosaccharide 1,2-alpha-mannosidase [Quercus suber]